MRPNDPELGLPAGSLNRRQFLHVTGGAVLGSVALSLAVACTSTRTEGTGPVASTSPTPAAESTKPTPVQGAAATAVAPAPTAAQAAVATMGRPAGAASVLPTYVEFKAAVDYVRDLNAAGLFHPNTNTYNIISARGDFIASRFVVHAEGWAPWNDFWRQGRQLTPPVNFGHIYPFPAQDGGRPAYYLYQGFVAATAMKKAAVDRTREILRIMNWLAAPFGSAEDALLTYGIKDVHYTVDDKGNPKPTANGLAEARYVPWQYVTQRPQVQYIADIPGYVEAAVQAEQTLVPLGVADPSLGFYSPLQGSKGPTTRQTMLEGVRDIIAGRRPMSD